MKQKQIFVLLLLLLSGSWVACLKEDNTQRFTDIYWFRSDKLTFKIDTSLQNPILDSISVFRFAGISYPSDTVDLLIMPDSTTAQDPKQYQIVTRPVRFANADTTRTVVVLEIQPHQITDTCTIGLKLNYDFPNCNPLYRRHDRVWVTLIPIYVAPPVVETPEESEDPDPTE
ncbi:MAG: hypothetical protein PHV49_03980 [Alistipes sp.]|nr:hypothetical protein [Alistipes sp.]